MRVLFATRFVSCDSSLIPLTKTIANPQQTGKNFLDRFLLSFTLHEIPGKEQE